MDNDKESTGRSASPSGQRPPHDPASDDDRQRLSLVALIIILLAAGGLYYFVNAFVAWDKEQACVTSGRRNC